MQKYKLGRETLKMTIVLRSKIYKILFHTARIAYENTYDMRVIFTQIVSLKTLLFFVGVLF